MASGYSNILKIPELRGRVLFTIALLGVYRVGVFIPVPGTNRAALSRFFESGGKGTLLGLYDMFSGGALEQFSVFTLGIMPYITASIIIQLLTVVVPSLERLSKEGETGRRRITQYTRYGTIVIAAVQSYFIAYSLESMRSVQDMSVVVEPGWSFRLMAMITLCAGTAFIMWLGEQISERGIGNGISLIIFAGIVAQFPLALYNTINQVIISELSVARALLLAVLMIAVIAVIIFCERGQRRIPVQYAKRVVGRKVYGGQTAHLPLKINTAGVIPPIFASSLMVVPATISSFIGQENYPWLATLTNTMRPDQVLYNLLYVLLIVFFCYFYTAVTFNPDDVAENMKKYNGFIPGIRPGKKTAEYIDRILTRITLGGALYLSTICVLPTVLLVQFNVPFYFGGTSLLIVVGVALDTVAQIDSHLLTREYEGLLGARGGRVRGRRR